MAPKCPCCENEKNDVGPKIVGKTNSKDPRLASQNDALITKVMCNDCYNSLKNSHESTLRCLNSNCDNILFVSGRLGQDTDMRGVDRDIRFLNDSRGYYIECPKCGSKHNVEMWKGPEGSGGRWKVSGLRT